MDRYEFLVSRSNWEELGETFLKQFVALTESLPDLYFEQFLRLCERYNFIDFQLKPLVSEIQNPAKLQFLLAETLHDQGKNLMSQNRFCLGIDITTTL